MHLLIRLLTLLYALDRLLKLAAVVHFFRQNAPPPPSTWPSLSLIQPVTRSRHDLRVTLGSRLALRYPGPMQHLLVCDEADSETQALCRMMMAAHPQACVSLLTVAPDGGAIASKLAKMQAALPHATGEVLLFVDDDVALRPDALATLLPHLEAPGVGAVFGLACYSNWAGPWSSLMSGFVNANALLSYIPLCYLTEPYTITGHCFALRRATFAAIGGLDGMAGRIDDDHELARRVRRAGLRNEQTPLVYDVDNPLGTWHAYNGQLKRWFVFPRQLMLPQLTPREQAVSFLGSVGNLLPGLLALLALWKRTRAAGVALGMALALFTASYAWCEWRYLKRRTPWRRWPLLPVVAIVTPWHVLSALLSDDVVEWRGQRLRVLRGGGFEVEGKS